MKCSASGRSAERLTLLRDSGYIGSTTKEFKFHSLEDPMKVGEAIARAMKAEGMQILCGYPVNHLIEFAAAENIRPI